MRFALFLFLGLVLLAAAALAGEPDDHGVTVLRGSSAPPSPAPPPASETPSTVQREIVYTPYPVYLSPGFVVPGFIVSTRHHRSFPVTTTTVPNGWPLFVGNSTRH
ncbi:hypothetical protein [Enhydrobacter sp.]|jgi:hypothetical protein|uniref:hypothetical protein n=1 Tax=Enhydrobacter sp. TaxID=1894999 RepID=UPI00260E9B78|nr:hypothetical protein [Enhydrobacter sp.]WIM09770.1 MAG: hypothetical protein OJF58_000723 [Enhydrobacter sp.]